ncbi:MAG: spermidine synthase [Hyphomicrobiaceae bacterium]|jgi:spermidine synthase
MNKIVLIDEALTPDGELLKLTTQSGYFQVSLEGASLMSSHEHHSEEFMTDLVCQRAATIPNARILVGGLGMGYTLRAALDRLASDATVVVVELMPAVLRWNQGPLGHLANHPLDDPRTQCEVIDLVEYFQSAPEPFDGMLLDVDNGPEPFTTGGNVRLYDERGVQRLYEMLKPDGTVVVWSAFECPEFLDLMKCTGFVANAVNARSRGKRGGHHTLFVGNR